MVITIICASNEENVLLAGAFDEYRGNRLVFRGIVNGQNQRVDFSVGEMDSIFEEPFWVGVFGCVVDGKLSVRKVTFGAEAKY